MVPFGRSINLPMNKKVDWGSRIDLGLRRKPADCNPATAEETHGDKVAGEAAKNEMSSRYWTVCGGALGDRERGSEWRCR